MQKTKSKTTLWQRFNLGWARGVFVFVLVFVSGLALTQTALATHGPGPTPSDVSCTICPDNDKDGYRAYCDTSHVFDKSFGCGYPPPDCNDADAWSHFYGSKDIASVKVEYAPAYVAKTPPDKKFTPALSDLLVTVTFKAKKCGMAVTPDIALMNVSYTTKDSSGNEISSWLLLQGAPGFGKPGNLYRVSDLVYRGTILTYGGDPRFFPANLEPYIASVAAGRPVQLKFVGPDIGSSKDTPKYQTLPMKLSKVIIIGGFGAPARHKIFSTLGSLAPGAIKIPLRIKSMARNTVKIREEINKQLVEGNEVLIVGHSMGSIIAYNLQKEFAVANKCVSGVYIDPPYDFLLCKIPLVNLIPAIASFKKACEGIESDPNTINWTNGKGLLYFFDHDAFTFPNHGNNKQKVEDLKKVVKSRLGGSFSACSFGSVPPPISLTPTPAITGISSSSVRPGDSITVTGSGFSPAGNIVDIQHATYAQVYYELFNVPSTNNGTTLTFVLPPSPVPPIQTVPGKYFLKVSAVGSDWSNALTVQVAK